MADPPRLPESFRLDPSTCGIRVEGGQNRPGEPAHNGFDGELPVTGSPPTSRGLASHLDGRNFG
jgi:hypothetical protein